MGLFFFLSPVAKRAIWLFSFLWRNSFWSGVSGVGSEESGLKQRKSFVKSGWDSLEVRPRGPWCPWCMAQEGAAHWREVRGSQSELLWQSGSKSSPSTWRTAPTGSAQHPNRARNPGPIKRGWWPASVPKQACARTPPPQILVAAAPPEVWARSCPGGTARTQPPSRAAGTAPSPWETARYGTASCPGRRRTWRRRCRSRSSTDLCRNPPRPTRSWADWSGWTSRTRAPTSTAAPSPAKRGRRLRKQARAGPRLWVAVISGMMLLSALVSSRNIHCHLTSKYSNVWMRRCNQITTKKQENANICNFCISIKIKSDLDFFVVAQMSSVICHVIAYMHYIGWKAQHLSEFCSIHLLGNAIRCWRVYWNRQFSAMVEKKKSPVKTFSSSTDPVRTLETDMIVSVCASPLSPHSVVLLLPPLHLCSSPPRYRPEAFYLLPGVCNLGWVIPHLSPQPLCFIRFSRPHPQVRLSCYKKHHVIWHLGAIPVAPSSPAVNFFFFWGGIRKKACAQDSGRVSLELELMNEEIGTRENKERTKKIISFFFLLLFTEGCQCFCTGVLQQVYHCSLLLEEIVYLCCFSVSGPQWKQQQSRRHSNLRPL